MIYKSPGGSIDQQFCLFLLNLIFFAFRG